MSSIVGARAITLASTPGAVEERPHARTFTVRARPGVAYTVVVGARPVDERLPDVCTCQAGQRAVKCAHVAAVHLVIARELRAAREAGLTPAEYHELRRERPANVGALEPECAVGDLEPDRL